MTKVELAQKIKDSNYTCGGINCSECIRVNGFGCCLQCDKKLFVSLVLPAKSKKDKLEKRIEQLEKENAELKAEIENNRDLPAIAYIQGAGKQKEKDEAKLADLQKENAELKARLNAINLLTPELEKRSKLKRQQLTTAKELLERFLGLGNLWDLDCKDYLPLRKEVEQFLKEIKK